MFHALMDVLEAKKDDCIMIDDRMSNIEAALDFGISGILCPACSTQAAYYLEALLIKMDVFVQKD